MKIHDPLLEFEQMQSASAEEPIQIPPVKKQKFWKKRLWQGVRLMTTYCVLTGCIFSILMGITNFSAYSARIENYINPEAMQKVTSDMQNILTNASVSVHAAGKEEEKLVREVIEERLILKNPELVFSRHYDANTLLSGISPNTSASATFKVMPAENRIVIPKLGENIPLIDVAGDVSAKFSELHEVFLEQLKNGVVRYPGTALPGEKGNLFIFGHSSNYPWIKSNYNKVFALLDHLKPGDEIIVYYNQKKFVYHMKEQFKVKPGDVNFLKSRDPKSKEISLMTCWPVGTVLERLIIIGELVE